MERTRHPKREQGRRSGLVKFPIVDFGNSMGRHKSSPHQIGRPLLDSVGLDDVSVRRGFRQTIFVGERDLEKFESNEIGVAQSTVPFCFWEFGHIVVHLVGHVLS